MRHIRINMLVVLTALSASLLQAQDDYTALVQRAVQFQQSGDYKSAAEVYRAVLKLRPDDVATHVNLGVVLVQLGEFDEAIAEYESAGKLLPGDPRIELNLALAYEKSGRLEQARKRFEALHLAAPQDAKISMLLADCRLQLDDDAGVIDLLRPLEGQNSNDLGVAYMLGIALLHEHRIQESQVLLDRILRNGDTAEARFLLGTRMFETGDYPAAVRQLASAIELNPGLPQLQSLYGQALLNTGDPDAAAAAFRKELASNPNDYQANLRLGQILTVRKQFPEAAPFLQRALLLRPDSNEAKLALADAKSRRRPTESVAGAGDPGPQVNEIAPDFTLNAAGSNKPVSLHDFRGRSSVVLVFGSYSCPNLRSSADALKAMQQRYGTHVPFLLVYIREAHAAGDWQSTRNVRDDVTLAPATTLAEKQDHATMCTRKLHLPFPAVVDSMNGATEAAYNAWPSRAFIIGQDGHVLYSTRLTELDFHPEDMESVLRTLTKNQRASKR